MPIRSTDISLLYTSRINLGREASTVCFFVRQCKLGFSNVKTKSSRRCLSQDALSYITSLQVRLLKVLLYGDGGIYQLEPLSEINHIDIYYLKRPFQGL